MAQWEDPSNIGKLFMQGLSAGSSAKENQARRRYYDTQTQTAERKRLDEENMQDTSAMMQDPAYREAMQDPATRSTFYQDRGIRPAQGQAIDEAGKAKRQKELSDYAGMLMLTTDKKQFDTRAKWVHSQMTPEEQKQYGDPESWSAEGAAALVPGFENALKIHKAFTERERANALSTKAKTSPGKGGTATTYVQLYNHAKKQGLDDDEAEAWADERYMTTKEKPAEFEKRKKRKLEDKVLEGATDTGKTSGGKKVYKLADGNFYIKP